MKALLVWLSDPANIVLLGTAIGGALSVIFNVLQKLKLLRAAGVIGELKDDVEKTTGTVVSLVQGIEKVKRTMTEVHADSMARILKDHAEETSTELTLAPIVTAVQAGMPAESVVKRATGRLDDPGPKGPPGQVGGGG